jgi:heme-degrading monooxygenase HmoA
LIIEVGLFRIGTASADEFAPVAESIRSAFASGVIPGLRSFHMQHAIEDTGRWTVLVGWDSVDAHERFVASEEGERQRVLIGQFSIGQTEVFHIALDDVVHGLR